MRIVQLANLYAPGSGGLRTAVDALGRGYLAAGHERVLVVPGERFERTESETDGLVVTVPGRPVASGYRVITSLRPVLRLLAELAPDSVEVSDKLTLVKAARWARRTGRRSVLLSHERIDAILAPRVPGWFPLTAAADRWNRRLVRAFDAVVATSAFGAAEFERVGAPGLRRVPLGVDLETFRPAGTVRPEDEPALLVCAGRLSAEKNPRLAVETARVLHKRGVPIRLELVGDGPERERLAELAAGLPVALTGHLEGRAAVAARLAAAGAEVVGHDAEVAAARAERDLLAAQVSAGEEAARRDRTVASELAPLRQSLLRVEQQVGAERGGLGRVLDAGEGGGGS